MLRRLLQESAFLPAIPEPKSYKFSIKVWITFIVAQAAAIETYIVLVFYPALPQLPQDLVTSSTIANLSVALPSVATAIFPLYWSYFSERQGRRLTYLISLTIFVLFSVLAAISRSINMLLAMRTLSGAAGCAVTSTGAAVISDIWAVEQKGRAMSAYYVGILMGPTIGPVFGGLLVQRWGWEGVQWFLVIWSSCSLIFILSCLPETLRGNNNNKPGNSAVQTAQQMQVGEKIEHQQASRKIDSQETMVVNQTSQESLPQSSPNPKNPPKSPNEFVESAKLLLHAVISPLRILILFRSPIVVLTIYLASITFLVFRLFEISMQEAFSAAPYFFTPTMLGLIFLPNAAGLVAGNVLAGKWSDHLIQRKDPAAVEKTADDDVQSFSDSEAQPQQQQQQQPQQQGGAATTAGGGGHHGVHAPERRMSLNAWVPLILLPCSLVWYGWTVEFGVHSSAPIIADFFIGFSSGLIFSLVTTVLVELLPWRSSALVALNALGRNLFAAAGSAVGEPLIAAVGNGWAITICAAVVLASVSVVVAIRVWGRRWRQGLQRWRDI